MRVIIVCQEAVLVEGIQCLLSEFGDQIEIVGTTDSGREGIELAREKSPEVAIVGLTLTDLNGVDTTSALVADDPELRVLILAANPKEEPLQELLAAGARGYLTTTSTAEELAHALELLADGKSYLSPETTDVLLGQQFGGEPRSEDPVYAKLTPREREVLQLLANGSGTKEVAHDLGISSKTVDSHRRNIMEKLETDNLPDLVRHAIRAGLCSLEPDGV
ncbi:MAG: response regulator transcription factor [Candidatus Eisenbacteria bacterium]|nr:response regulator transcription factor [Candidatus Eisenbacteria bacterium]